MDIWAEAGGAMAGIYSVLTGMAANLLLENGRFIPIADLIAP